MGFTLDKVLPWGRSFDEYVRMFDLSAAELQLRILGCGDGPAEFNAALSQAGGRVVSLDPIYVFNASEIQKRIAETYDEVMNQIRLNEADYLWETISSVEDLGQTRMSAMVRFLADFDMGKLGGRYVAGELPALPFENKAFDLALSSHFLFLYSDQLTAEFHLRSLQEMLRVAKEARVFPVLTLDGKLSQHLKWVIEHLEEVGYGAELVSVPYEFQRGANQMLVVKPISSAN